MATHMATLNSKTTTLLVSAENEDEAKRVGYRRGKVTRVFPDREMPEKFWVDIELLPPVSEKKNG